MRWRRVRSDLAELTRTLRDEVNGMESALINLSVATLDQGTTSVEFRTFETTPYEIARRHRRDDDLDEEGGGSAVSPESRISRQNRISTTCSYKDRESHLGSSLLLLLSAEVCLSCCDKSPPRTVPVHLHERFSRIQPGSTTAVMTPNACMESWTLPAASTAQEVSTPALPSVFESSILSRNCTVAAMSAIVPVAAAEPRIPRLKAQVGAEKDKKSHPAAGRAGPRSKKLKKCRTLRAKPCSSRPTKKALSDFDELMLKLEAVDSSRLVLQIPKLEAMSAAELRAIWHA